MAGVHLNKEAYENSYKLMSILIIERKRLSKYVILVIINLPAAML